MIYIAICQSLPGVDMFGRQLHRHTGGMGLTTMSFYHIYVEQKV